MPRGFLCRYLFRSVWAVLPSGSLAPGLLLPGSLASLLTALPRLVVEAADTLAAFLTALHQVAPEEAPAGRNRGGPLRDSAKNFPYFLKETTDRGLIPDPDAVRAVWNYALAAPDWTGTALWLHGDLHPANLRDRSSLRRTPGPAAGADSAG